jgi:hypothetical protein
MRYGSILLTQSQFLAEENMSDTKSSRRRFIKTAAAGAVGLAIGSRALSAQTPILVKVTFEGAMVFHPLKGSNDYEVGVLVPLIAPCHNFSIVRDGKPIPPADLSGAMSMGNSWHLDVINMATRNARVGTMDPPKEEGHMHRLDDTAKNQYDLSWIADFESTEFHGDGKTPLRMTPNLLKPIIRLSKGQLRSEYKIEKLKRKKGMVPAPAGDFGFMTETVGLNINLMPGEALVLKVQQNNHEVFNIPYAAGTSPLVKIGNFLPLEMRHGSHFQVYYGLFPDYVRDEDKFDIELECPREVERKSKGKSLGRSSRCTPVFPINKHPDISIFKKRTVGDYPCGGIRLHVRPTPLE